MGAKIYYICMFPFFAAALSWQTIYRVWQPTNLRWLPIGLPSHCLIGYNRIPAVRFLSATTVVFTDRDPNPPTIFRSLGTESSTIENSNRRSGFTRNFAAQTMRIYFSDDERQKKEFRSYTIAYALLLAYTVPRTRARRRKRGVG